MAIRSKALGAVMLALAGGVCVWAGDPGNAWANPAAEAAAYDPVAQDPVVLDKAHPPLVHEVEFASGEVKLYGKVYSAQGTVPRPTVLIARGYPDMTSSADIVYTLQRAGYNAMIFNYRGAWGMGGSFSQENCYQDMKAALAFLRSYSTSHEMLIDPNNIILFGYSLGGPTALRLAAEDERVRGVLSLDGLDMRQLALLSEAERKDWAASLVTPAVPGADGGKIIDGIVDHMGDWDGGTYASGLAGKDVFLVWAAHGNGALRDKADRRLADIYAKRSRVTERVFDTNHDFSDQRIALARATLAWLGTVSLAPAGFTERPKEVPPSAAQLAGYAGTYDAPGIATAFFKAVDGRLYFANPEHDWYPLFSLGDGRFLNTEEPQAECSEMDFSAAGVSMHCEYGTGTELRIAAEVQFAPEPAMVTAPPALLQQYVGRYRMAPEIGPPGEYVEIAVRDGQLLALLQHGRPARLYAQSPSRFFMRRYPATMEFMRNVQGQVTHIRLESDGKSFELPRLP